MPKDPRILVLGCESATHGLVQKCRLRNGWDTWIANDADRGFNVFLDFNPHLTVIDSSLSWLSAIGLCARMRECSPFAALIVLTSGGDEGRIIEALDSGADDCLAKPISNDELLARIRARLRRAVQLENSAPHSPIEAGEFSVEPDTRRVLVRGRPIHLTPKEFALLVYMMQHPGKVLTHRALLKSAWGVQRVQQPECLRVLINQLRRKIEPTQKPLHILTEPWVGYRFEPVAQMATDNGALNPSLACFTNSVVPNLPTRSLGPGTVHKDDIFHRAVLSVTGGYAKRQK